MLRRKLPLDDTALAELLAWPADIDRPTTYHYPLAVIVTAAEARAAQAGLSPALNDAVAKLVSALCAPGGPTENLRLANRLQACGKAAPQVVIQPGEAWSDASLADLAAMPAEARSPWTALLAHCQGATSGKPTARWLSQAEKLIDAVGCEEFRARLLSWFPLVDRPRTVPLERQHAWQPDMDQQLLVPHADLLKGIVWCCGRVADRDLTRAISALAVSAYRKIPGVGPRLVSLGNACVWALGAMSGIDPVGQLALLKVKIKFATAQKEIEKALSAAAEREGLPRDEVDELAVPTYGLQEVGVERERVGDYIAELAVDGTDAQLRWTKTDGKPLKSIPAAVKKEHADEFKELQAAVKDIRKMLPAQRERLDALFLQQKSWPFPVWRERYLDHPLVGTLARRLVWVFDGVPGVWHEGGFVDADDRPITLADGPTVTLWHPIGRQVADVLAWREWFERHGVRQPFKQAHREVYVLTDAERATRVYTNRYAAHVIRQHQFNALAAARGWRHPLRMMVDADYPPATRMLPVWGLRAEFWVEGVGDQFGTDTNDAGAFLRLTTDQVRFYAIDAAQRHAHAGGGGYRTWNQIDAEPVPLEQIPPLVFSEVMRDVDLFVGVASVGNDPAWADGGPDGRFRNYWQSYSFGELSGTARTRKETLERVVPRLKIGGRCSFEDRFLVVRGDLRTYKIHLGSGNILMSPNNQYLCIVPRQSGTAGERVFLPFEGDGTLSVILSKAILLAEDGKITDATITSQIKAR